MADMQELVHSCLVRLPSGRHETMFFVRPSDAEKLLQQVKQQAAEIERLRYEIKVLEDQIRAAESRDEAADAAGESDD